MTSKRFILALTALLTLTCAGLLAAQTATDTTTPTTGQEQPSMAMDNTASDAAVQTMVGIVQSFDGNNLVLRTSSGDHTFLVASSTVRPAAVQANLPVTVSYVTESGGDRAVRVVENTQASAESQTPGGQVTGTDSAAPTGSTYSNGTTGSMATHDSMATGTTGSMNDTTGSTTTGSTYDSTSATGTTVDTTTPSTSSTAATRGNGLPKTASDAPLMGLVGLLALAGAAGLHAFGRNA